MLRRLLARTFWTLSRWRLQTEPAPTTPTVFVAAPHTSNWDFVLMLAVAWQLGVEMHWMGKDSLFRGPAGPIMRALGGIAVDRSNAGHVVSELAGRMKQGSVFGLVIAPDGTRGAHTHWKSGFHRIAMDTGMPVTLCYVDRTTMTSGLGPTLTMTGDVHHDMERIRAFYADKAGFHPHLRVEPRLREEADPR
jgi:1-acyl-sn-glycerol-3-phosphate acyltransferase